jgi:hypothetical protein
VLGEGVDDARAAGDDDVVIRLGAFDGVEQVAAHQ